MPSRSPHPRESARSSSGASPKPAREAGAAPTEPWASIEDAAAHLGVRKDSIYRWIEARGLPARKIGKLWKLKLSEIDAWVNAAGASDEAPAPDAPLARSPSDHLIMVIDDEELVRETLGDFLKDAGYRVVLASNGAHALKQLATQTILPSLILLDLKMPDVDGWQFRELQLRDRTLAAIPVIVLSGTPNATVRDASVVLRKPLRLPVIGKAIQTVLEPTKEAHR